MLPAGLVPIVTRFACAKAGMPGTSATAAPATLMNWRRLNLLMRFLPDVFRSVASLTGCFLDGRRSRRDARMAHTYSAAGELAPW
jgi:hypothetical protein